MFIQKCLQRRAVCGSTHLEPDTQGAEEEDLSFKASLVNTARPCLKQTNSVGKKGSSFLFVFILCTCVAEVQIQGHPYVK